MERCRVLAHAAVDKYCPDDPVWKEFAHAVYSVLSAEPMTDSEIAERLNSDMTSSQFSNIMKEIGNPFVSNDISKKYFGPDASWDNMLMASTKTKKGRKKLAKSFPASEAMRNGPHNAGKTPSFPFPIVVYWRYAQMERWLTWVTSQMISMISVVGRILWL